MLRPLIDTDPAVIGPYRLHQRIGSGGMGVVYLGYGAQDRPVAVKVPHEYVASDPAFRARFRAEVAAARHVRAPSVAAVIDADVDCVRPWLATEYVPGPTLHAAVLERRPLVDGQLDDLAIGLATALAAIHDAQVVHRDLKPANIVMSWEGPKIIDFGIARSADYSGYTQAGELVGTIAWMSPEQLDGHVATAASDVFAWACCLVFAATGRRPFAGETQEIVALRITATEPDLDGVPDRLCDVVRRCLHKEPDERPTAAALVDVLTCALRPRGTPDRPGEHAAPVAREDGSATQAPDHDETRQSPHPRPLTTPPLTTPRPTHGPPTVRPAAAPAPLVAGLVLVLVLGGLLGAAGLWAAGTGHPHPDVVGVAAAMLVGAACAQMLFPSGQVTGTLVTVLAAFTGAGGGVVLARASGVDQPGRILLAVAATLLVATGCAFAMAPSAPGPPPP